MRRSLPVMLDKDMSIWVRVKNRDGTIDRWSVPIPLEALLVLAAVAAEFLAPRYFAAKGNVTTDALAAILAGFCLFALSKLSVYRKGELKSWGTRYMSPLWRLSYWLGYGLMALGGIVIYAVSASIRA